LNGITIFIVLFKYMCNIFNGNHNNQYMLVS